MVLSRNRPARAGRAQRRRQRRAALALVLVAPAVAELTLGSISVRMLWLVVLYVPIYGAGVLLIREAVRRTGGGAGALLLMGLAYGLVEEGLALQSLTSPHLYGAAGWGPRPWGVNAPYAELNLPYHAVFSVLLPVTLVELMFRDLGRRPYLRRGGLVGTAAAALLGVGLLRVSVPPSQDPGYLLSGRAVLVVLGLAAAAVVVAALVRFPRRAGRRRAGVAGPVPGLFRLGAVCAVAAFAFLALLFPFAGAHHCAFLPRAWAPLPMAAAAVVAAAAAWAVRRWSAADGWTARHRLAAVTGALVAHTAFGLVSHTRDPLDTAGLAVIGAVMVLLLHRLDDRLAAGPAAPIPDHR
ncbi:hypothetical protein GCM10010402_82260 [Actinomadura luteofluorescens]|uniref:hypothetical protein n=1 Tax=Actinomadura luteofluorescens TaxID=46163 RepID=UPI0021647F15|nr:hypothetical protein [Actinomadura glauciflava]MCR3738997.1 hypothetical protein [Actinomadura glauciflava]